MNIYNSLTGQKQALVPINPGQIGIYVCGVTVYDYCHIGHARVFVVFDMVVRHLRELGYQVRYVRNITDIDDKIIARANERDEPFTQLTETFIQAMTEDMANLGVLPPDEEPRATVHIDHIVEMIEQLERGGYAYPADNGDVYYRVNRFANYGQLGGRDLEKLRSGARVEVNEHKENPLDFVLWKASKAGEPSWPSPWGDGRPGWHIECSAMSTHCLGHHFDIHGGGFDLQFPHHENEIAQSEAATGETFVNTWMHNGFVRIDDEKMSKSLDNFFTIREVLERYPAEVVRYFLLASHYRSALNFSNIALDQAWDALRRCYRALLDQPDIAARHDPDHPFHQRYLQAMNDDFNTPEALAVVFDLVRELNTAAVAQRPELAAQLLAMGNSLGLLQQKPETFLRLALHSAGEAGLVDQQVEALIVERLAARANKDWQQADEIRDQLTAAGIVLEDADGQTRWARR